MSEKLFMSNLGVDLAGNMPSPQHLPGGCQFRLCRPLANDAAASCPWVTRLSEIHRASCR
jgi:hypothetical protein